MPHGWLGLDWGNVPAWTGSVLTGSSLLIAANTYRLSVRDRVRQQASKIAAWVSTTSEDGRARAHLTFANNSDMPVYLVDVQLRTSGPRPEGIYGALPSEKHAESADVVPPGGLPARELEYESADVIEVEFTDASGLVWVRDDWGRLTQKQVTYTRGSLDPRGPDWQTLGETRWRRAKRRWQRWRER
jgi:hypothetical protein